MAGFPTDLMESSISKSSSMLSLPHVQGASDEDEQHDEGSLAVLARASEALRNSAAALSMGSPARARTTPGGFRSSSENLAPNHLR